MERGESGAVESSLHPRSRWLMTEVVAELPAPSNVCSTLLPQLC